ncbi:MAG: hypothetical protein JXR51_08975 [Bacteroidales bacterium]|nr:hypothetical protein [Bacteroidales bacterium]
MKSFLFLSLFFLVFSSCGNETTSKNIINEEDSTQIYKKMLNRYIPSKLNVDYSLISKKEKQMIPVFMEINQLIDDIFWYESFGNKDSLCRITIPELRQLVKLNFGPWDRFNNNKRIINCISEKPKGANFYPFDITKEEFERFKSNTKNDKYTFIRRDSLGSLKSIKYNIILKEKVDRIANLLETAASLAEDKDFSNYLKQRAKAFLTDEYDQSDLAWLETNNNTLDFIVGPIDVNEDALFGYKTEHSSYLLIKQKEWTKRLAKYTLMLPFLQKALPVPEEYRKENPEIQNRLEVCDVVALGGFAKAGGYAISVSYPNLSKYLDNRNNRNIQFVNILQAKYDNILNPIANHVLDEDFKQFNNFEAFFLNSIFFELGLNLGLKKLINRDIKVRDALKEYSTVLDVVKAYTIGLYFAEKLYSVGEIKDIRENYTVFLLSLIRTLRFGYSNDYARASTIIFNFIEKQGCITYTSDKKFKLDFDKLKIAIPDLISQVVVIQGNGNYLEAKKFVESNSDVSEQLSKIIVKLSDNQIPTDIKLN